MHPVKPNSALVIVGHGSTLNPDSSAPTLDHAETIRKQGLFAEVVCAFWKEEPGMREVLRMVDSPEIYVVPNFISEGYFTQQVIPRELDLEGRTTLLPALTNGGPPRRVHYCDPVGVHPSMIRLLLARATEVAPDAPRAESALIIVGHGTGLNENSTKAIKDAVELIRQSGAGFAEVLDAYMEEAPLIAEWDTLTSAPNVIVVPFFIADGLHSFQDIPVLLGIEEEITAAASRMSVFKQNPHSLRNRQLFYSSAIGTEPLLAEVILDQVQVFDEAGSLTTQAADAPSSPGSPTAALTNPGTLAGGLASWLDSGGRLMGEVVILPAPVGWILTHHLDESLVGSGTLDAFDSPLAARLIARDDAAGEFRPLKTAPTLKRGWQLALTTLPALQEALDSFYPALLANALRHAAGLIPPRTLKETLGRQTGMYRVTGLLRADEAQLLVAKTCNDSNCLRKILWSWDGATSWEALPPEKTCCPSGSVLTTDSLPLLCTDACQLLIGPARTVVKTRQKSEADAAALAAAAAAAAAC
ncbi:MAG: hypothetical protein JWL81_841 [Verrucomicrobiales bacterium]|nr:hypothetical protein [Verrucomicrobiales bacterium]